MSEIPDYIKKFIEAVYPDSFDLALQMFDEKTCIKDATEAIISKDREIAELKDRVVCLNEDLGEDVKCQENIYLRDKVESLEAEVTRLREALSDLERIAKSEMHEGSQLHELKQKIYEYKYLAHPQEPLPWDELLEAARKVSDDYFDGEQVMGDNKAQDDLIRVLSRFQERGGG